MRDLDGNPSNLARREFCPSQGDFGTAIATALKVNQMAFILYDLETTGKLTAFDQILQFAAIKTDDELSILDTFDVRCRLSPHIVPSPEALLITGVEVADLTDAPISHFEMMRQIHAKMRAWSMGGAVFVG